MFLLCGSRHLLSLVFLSFERHFAALKSEIQWLPQDGRSSLARGRAALEGHWWPDHRAQAPPLGGCDAIRSDIFGG